MTRAQSHVVGVALLLGISVVALGGLTVGVGELVDAQTASADATRVANGLDSALEPAATTGPRTEHLQFTGGTLTTAPRTVRLLRDGTVVATIAVDALVFESADRRVAFLGGAIVRGDASNAWFARDPLVTASERNAVLAVGAPRLGAGDVAVSGGGGTAVTLRTNVTHDQRSLGTGQYAVAIETETPEPFERYFTDQNATTTRRAFDDDRTDSVVARYSGDRRGYLVVHDLLLEVGNG